MIRNSRGEKHGRVHRSTKRDHPIERFTQSTCWAVCSSLWAKASWQNYTLRYWVEQANVPNIYWVWRQSFVRVLWCASGRENPSHFDSWETLFEEVPRLFVQRPFILILDESPMRLNQIHLCSHICRLPGLSCSRSNRSSFCCLVRLL